MLVQVFFHLNDLHGVQKKKKKLKDIVSPFLFDTLVFQPNSIGKEASDNYNIVLQSITRFGDQMVAVSNTMENLIDLNRRRKRCATDKRSRQ